MKKSSKCVYILLAGKYICQVWPGRFAKMTNRFTYVQVSELLWDRADKYGYIRIPAG